MTQSSLEVYRTFIEFKFQIFNHSKFQHLLKFSSSFCIQFRIYILYSIVLSYYLCALVLLRFPHFLFCFCCCSVCMTFVPPGMIHNRELTDIWKTTNSTLHCYHRSVNTMLASIAQTSVSSMANGQSNVASLLWVLRGKFHHYILVHIYTHTHSKCGPVSCLKL